MGETTERYRREFEVAIATVRRAGMLARAVAASVPPAMQKADRSPVTIADYAVQALVCRALAEAFPEDSVVAEEDAQALRTGDHRSMVDRIVSHLNDAGAGDWEQDALVRAIDRGARPAPGQRFWTLDPIDGTKGFLRGGQYAIALSLVIDGNIALGVLGCPNLETAAHRERGVLFAAVRGAGSFAGRLDDGDTPLDPIRVATGRSRENLRVCESVESGHSDQDRSTALRRELGMMADAVRIDSQAKYGVVACGDADLYLRLPTRADYVERIWDHAAGALIVEEAGGRVTDVGGRRLDFGQGRGLTANRGVVASAGPHHDDVLRVLDKLGVG